jgi:hypothetical protein
VPKAPTEIASLARSYSNKAVKVLAGIMMQEECPPAARIAAAQTLLDRGWGKATQRTESENIHTYVLRVPAKETNVQTWLEHYAPPELIEHHE